MSTVYFTDDGFPSPNSVKASIKTTNSNNNSAKAAIAGVTQTAEFAKGNIRQRSFEKRFEYRVYNPNGTFVTAWTSEVLTDPRFRAVINGGPGEMVVRLARSFDDFGEDVDVKLFNRVKVVCFDRDAPTGALIYSGVITGYRPILDGAKEYVEITLLHTISEFSHIVLRNAAGETTISQSSLDPSQIFKNIIDYYRADQGFINYTPTSIDTTATTTSYTFSVYTIKEALDKAIELCPYDWYWRVDSDNILYLRRSNLNLADHSFIIGKHVAQMETWRRGEDIVNRIYFVGGDTGGGVPFYKLYQNSASISSYGIHAIKFVDQRVTLDTTATVMASRLLNTKKDPEIRTTITIVDNNGQNPEVGYDIESIKPGMTMKIRGLKQGVKTVSYWDQMIWDQDVWDQTLAYSAADVIQIQSIDYSPNFITIEASSRLPEISKRIEDIQRNLEKTQTLDVPSSPS